jgi:hypothetical protein
MGRLVMYYPRSPGGLGRRVTKMGSIYGNACLTIAAGSAISDQSGFLGLRSDLTVCTEISPFKRRLANVFL